MKLVSLYIENFGGLSRYSLNFEEGLTTLVEPNGFGKTTLAEFIRAMFYGFPRKSKTLDKSLRQKYAPWGGGQYGGNLVFEHEGLRYRIERTFGLTPKGDTVALIELAANKKITRFSVCADEVYKQTVLLNRGVKVNRDDLRLTIWKEEDHPEVLTMQHWPLIQQSQMLFDRKFDPTVDEDVINSVIRKVCEQT